MGSIDEKRVFSGALETARLLISCGIGIAYVDVAEERIGEFGVLHRCSARDITRTDTGFAIATDDDVLIATDSRFEPTGFAPAVAVSWYDDHVIAADEAGRIATYDTAWSTIGRLSTTITAIDGEFIATTDGVYRLSNDLAHVGLSAVQDVSAGPIPLAGTRHGLYELGNGWIRAIEGDFRFVSTGDTTPSRRAFAATPSACYERGEQWTPLDLPVTDVVVDATYTESPFLITTEGTLLVERADQWQSTPLGLPDVTGIAGPLRTP